jgi:micrococcal nuclease
MKRLLPFAVLITLCSFKVSAQIKIAAKDAAHHIGETVTITDKVYSTKLITQSNMTLLNLGGYYPNQTLTIMIPGADRENFKGLPEVYYKGKDVTVTGKIVDYHGKPEIVVTDPSQLKLVLTDNIVPIEARQ